MSDTSGETAERPSDVDVDMDMAEEQHGEALPAPATAMEPSEADYEAIEAAVMETARGRWFLKEYAKRNRNSDTQRVLTAVEKLGERLGEQQPASGDETSMALLSHNVLDLAEAITRVKLEVQELGGQGEQPDHFGTATVELEAIVEQTETATSEILEAAEKIQEVLWVLREEGASETQCDIIESKIIDVYTACSFQDLTGQRSNKVVQLVSYVERRVGAMMEVLGLKDDVKDEPRAGGASLGDEHEKAGSDGKGEATDSPKLAAHQENDARPDAHLLNGPAQEGDGIQQDDVDAMFDGPAVAMADPQAETDPVETVADDETADDAGMTEEAPETQAQDGQEDEGEENESEEDESKAVDGESDAQADAQTDDDQERAIYTDEMVVELHDAEILNQPSDEALASSALDQSDAAPDIFDVDALEFAGDDMLANGDSARDLEAIQEYASVRGNSMVLVDMPDDFAVDGASSDMFVETPGDDQEDRASAQTDDDSDQTAAEESPLGQDIFDADSIDVEDGNPEDGALDEAATSEDELDTALTTADMEENAAPADGDVHDAEQMDDEQAGAVAQAGGEAVTAEDEPAPYTTEERIALFS